MRKEGSRLIIEPVPAKSLRAVLAGLQPLGEKFPRFPDLPPRSGRSLMRYLLDTNIVSDLVRNPQGKIAEQILKIGETKVCTSIIVAAELRYGAEKKQSPRLSSQLEMILAALEILPLERPADTSYGSVRTQLKRAGKPIGANDMLIAAQALALGCTVVTDNEREFSRVKHLHVENWLR